MKERNRFPKSLRKLLHEVPEISITESDKFVVFSDLHIGNGSTRDDFLQNADFFKYILEHYYLKNGYKVVLNGDIEELQRFSFNQIYRQWADLYRIFAKLEQAKALYKIVGNHDLELQYKKFPFVKTPVYKGLMLSYYGHKIMVFHGHQASLIMERFYFICKLILRYIATPMGIKNFAHSHDSLVRFRTEKRVYEFAREEKLVSLIGHTHRPLFESLSKIDCLKYQIEQLCREYSKAQESRREEIAEIIRTHNRELLELIQKNKSHKLKSSLYDSDLLVPCIFNSGCAIGKRGITSIEIVDGNIALTHWFDRKKSQKHLETCGSKLENPEGSDYYRVVLKEDSLNYIFARIKLLA